MKPERLNRKNLPAVLRLAEVVSKLLPGSIKQAISTSPTVSALIRAQLNSSAPSGLTEVVVSSGALKGLKLKLDLKSEKYYWLGHYEPQLTQAIYNFCKTGMITYDVGADIGYISLVFAQAVGVSGQVYAFEPLPNNIQRIADHIALNSLQMVMQVVPYAISDYEGREMFLVHQNHAMGKLAGSSGRNFNYNDKIEVNSLRLDNFVYVQGNPHPHVIKIDIEGGAIKAIPGMLRLLSECRPILFIELHGPEERQVAWNALKQNHYVIHRMAKNCPEIAEINDIAWKEYIVALPRESRPSSDNVS